MGSHVEQPFTCVNLQLLLVDMGSLMNMMGGGGGGGMPNLGALRGMMGM